ncbi:hypothetical protein OSB04_016315 [Centaurea solstitialis]|uniref:Reverse transcriptase zinc-binding domain-containing protein n=1 Tax=Centaurea solstitialis TaxID=347529 RepID=A0AA38T0P8_9ASTR|nr:hypothetical protein OSB04_016315 [Centaurea solstitialis]
MVEDNSKKSLHFLWRVRLTRIPCRTNLDKKGIDLNSLLCPRRLVGKWWNKNLEGVVSVQDVLQEETSNSSNEGGDEVWTAVKWAFLYFIWRHRNSLIFEAAKTKLEDKFLELKRWTFEWISRRAKGWNKGLEVWSANPTRSTRNCGMFQAPVAPE